MNRAVKPSKNVTVAGVVETFGNVTGGLLLLRLWESGNPAWFAGFPSVAAFPQPLARGFCCLVSDSADCSAFGLSRRLASREMRSSLRSMILLS